MESSDDAAAATTPKKPLSNVKNKNARQEITHETDSTSISSRHTSSKRKKICKIESHVKENASKFQTPKIQTKVHNVDAENAQHHLSGLKPLGLDALYHPIKNGIIDTHLQFQWKRLHPNEVFSFDCTHDSSTVPHDMKKGAYKPKFDEYDVSDDISVEFDKKDCPTRGLSLPVEIRLEATELFDPPLLSESFIGMNHEDSRLNLNQNNFIGEKTDGDKLHHPFGVESSNHTIKEDEENIKMKISTEDNKTKLSEMHTVVLSICSFCVKECKMKHGNVGASPEFFWQNCVNEELSKRTKFLALLSYLDLEQKFRPEFILEQVKIVLENTSFSTFDMKRKENLEPTMIFLCSVGILILSTLAHLTMTETMGKYILIKLCPSFLQPSYYFFFMRNNNHHQLLVDWCKLSNEMEKEMRMRELAYKLRPLLKELAKTLIHECSLGLLSKRMILNVIKEMEQNAENGPEMKDVDFFTSELLNEMKLLLTEIFFG